MSAEKNPKLSPRQRAVLVEYARRAQAKKQREAFNDSVLFAQQKDFAYDPAQWRIALCSRRAGKTFEIAWELIHSAQKFENSRNWYISITLKVAKGLIWKTLRTMLEKFHIEHEVRLGDLQIHFPNGSTIELHGVKNEVDVEKLRGVTNLALAVVDEAQSIGPHLTLLENEVIAPALLDNAEARAALTGTPPARKTNTFAQMVQKAMQGKTYSLHRWTFADNEPLLKGRDAETLIQQEADRRGVPIDDPSIEREYRGKLVNDENSLIIPFGAKNYFTTAPKHTRHILGIDLGFDDPSAFFVWGYNDTDPYLWEVESYSRSEMLVSDVEAKVKELIAKYSPTHIVADQGGGGKQVVKSLIDNPKRKLRVPIEAAIKNDKETMVLMMADAAKRGLLKVRATGELAQQCDGLEWAYTREGKRVFPSNQRPKRAGKAEEDDSETKVHHHHDTFHAAYYAFRKLEHVWARVLKQPNVIDDPVTASQRQEEAMFKAHVAHVEKQRRARTDPFASLQDMSYDDPLGLGTSLGF